VKCHFREMEFCWSDTDDMGGCEEWLECTVCGHTKEVPSEYYRIPDDAYQEFKNWEERE